MAKEKKNKAVSVNGKKDQIPHSKDYAATLAHLKNQILEAQLRASVSVNKELLRLYWNIGASILERQAKHGWGSKIVERLANDIRESFPAMKGFSLTNVKYMAQFAKEYPDFIISQTAVGQITWSQRRTPMVCKENY
jgi:predicted nuclease of restriction endonuclease-like (RecB) superfamily